MAANQKEFLSSRNRREVTPLPQGNGIHSDAVASSGRTESIRSYGDQLAGRSRYITAQHVRHGTDVPHLLRYRWADPEGSPFYRIGIFAGIHGD